jgi:nicotinamide-nucleotide amidase
VEITLTQTVVHLLADRLVQLQWMISTAESCTGGMIASRCTDLAGSSAWFDSGFITYSNQAKSQMLGVPEELIANCGAVSEHVAKAMALGAVYRSNSKASVAVTGIAGPSGGSPEKPVGTVWIAWCIQGIVHAELQQLTGGREQIREETVNLAIEGLLARLPNKVN